MKDLFHQVSFLFIALLIVTGLRLLLGDYIRFLGTTDIMLYLIVDGILLVILSILYVLTKIEK